MITGLFPSMRSKEWQIAYMQMSKMLKDLDRYVDSGDFVNAKHIGKMLAFHCNIYPQYEEERQKKKL